MRIADLVKRKGTKVRVRVPTHLQKQLGVRTMGTVRGIEPNGGIAWVRVLIGKHEHKFRPQDLDELTVRHERRERLMTSGTPRTPFEALESCIWHPCNDRRPGAAVRLAPEHVRKLLQELRSEDVRDVARFVTR